MYLGESSPDFPALLKNNYGEFQAEGRARITKSDYSITFTSDFVPLYPVGTPMQVIRLYQGHPIHHFHGTVYLSDKRLMRLVSVEDKLLPGAEEVYCTNTSFPGKVSLCKSSLPWYRRIIPKSPTSHHVKIIGFNRQQIEFQLAPSPALEMGTYYNLEVPEPFPLSKTIVYLQKGMLFGQTASYLCDFVDLSRDEKEHLQQYMWAYTEQHAALL